METETGWIEVLFEPDMNLTWKKRTFADNEE